MLTYKSDLKTWMFRSKYIDVMLIYGIKYPLRPYLATFNKRKHGTFTSGRIKIIW